jgi:hypothetical protein
MPLPNPKVPCRPALTSIRAFLCNLHARQMSRRGRYLAHRRRPQQHLHVVCWHIAGQIVGAWQLHLSVQRLSGRHFGHAWGCAPSRLTPLHLCLISPRHFPDERAPMAAPQPAHRNERRPRQHDVDDRRLGLQRCAWLCGTGSTRCCCRRLWWCCCAQGRSGG